MYNLDKKVVKIIVTFLYQYTTYTPYIVNLSKVFIYLSNERYLSSSI